MVPVHETDALSVTDWSPWPLSATLAERISGGGRPRGPLGGPRFAYWSGHAWARADHAAAAERIRAAGVDPDTFPRLLDEDPDALRTRLGPEPAWARQFRTEAVHSGAGNANIPGLPVLLAPLVRAAEVRLAGLLEPLPDVGSRGAFLATVPLRRLVEAANPTLILELNVARVEGRLAGGTPEERFADFCRQLGRPDTVRAFWGEYPVLARYIATQLDRWVRATVELATRLAADLPALVAAGLLPADPGPLRSVTADAGDTHRDGRSVAILRFAAGTVVYKPRSLAVDAAFTGVLDWVDGHGGPGHRKLRLLERDGYGWSEFAERADCADDAEVRAFYTRAGSLLALLYLFSATDLHYQNLIAAGTHPVLVDLESLLQDQVAAVTREPRPGGDDPAARLLERSVLSIGLLPTPMLVRDAEHRQHRVDISGIGAIGTQVAWTEVGVAQGAGTDSVRIARARPTMRLELTNQPTVAGAAADPAGFVDDLVAGFDATYRLLATHRDDPGLHRVLAGFRDVGLRAILRPSQAYAKLLSDSLHPDFLRDAVDRHICLDRLYNGLPTLPGRTAVVESEIAQLIGGDIPLFEFRADGRALSAPDGTQLADVLPHAPYDTLTARLRGLGDADRWHQVRLIRGAYTSLTLDGAGWPVADTPVGSAAVDPADLRAAAGAIADTLLADAVVEGRRIGWAGLTLSEDQFWTQRHAGFDLYAGRSGIGLFLAYAGVLADRPRALQTALTVADGVVAELDEVLTDVAARQARGPLPAGAAGTLMGGYTGAGGALYFLAALARLTGETRWTVAARDIAGAVADLCRLDVHHDVVGGAPGAILSLLHAKDLIGADTAVELAAMAAEHLLAGADTAPGAGYVWASPLGVDRAMLTGFSHGASGIAHAFAELYAHRPDPRYAAAAAAALRYERAHFDAAEGNWHDLRDGGAPSTVRAFATYWCHGAPGIALARLALLRSATPGLGGPELLESELSVAIGTTDRRYFTGDRLTGARTHSLCHGDVGNLSILDSYARQVGDTGRRERVSRLWRTLLDSAATDGWTCGLPRGVSAPGLMAGLSGIGMGLLRAADPARTPDVLLLG